MLRTSCVLPVGDEGLKVGYTSTLSVNDLSASSLPQFIVLSDYSGSLARALRAKRDREHAKALAVHRARVEQMFSYGEKHAIEAKSELMELRLLRALKSWIDSTRARREACMLAMNQPMSYASIEEQKAIAGHVGEQRLDGYLRQHLDRRYTIIVGYHGKHGEIDRIVVGPLGIMAFEIKSHRGVIYASGKRWEMGKLDRYGREVERKPMDVVPDAQLNRALGWIERWLARNGIERKVGRAILFSSPDARIGHINGIQVPLVLTLRGIERLGVDRIFAMTGQKEIDAETCKRIVQLIVRDHEYCARQAESRGERRSGFAVAAG
jgi:hypothetical protein